MPTITPSVASQTVTIAAHPTYAITPTYSASSAIYPTPSTAYNFDSSNPTALPEIGTAPAPLVLGGITVQPDINLEIGIASTTGTVNAIRSFEYTFDNFLIPAEYAATLKGGDVVMFQNSPGANSYNTALVKAEPAELTKGAYHNLWMFISYSASSHDLILKQKGYFDFTSESTNFGTWEVGRTLYLNASGNLDILPSSTSAHWVRSLGYCIPNKENKRRIWFEPDSTYLKLT